MQLTLVTRADKQNKDGSLPVRAIITFEGARIRKNIKGVKVLPNHWKKERVKPNSKNEAYNNHIEYNQILDEFVEKAHNIFRYFHLNQLRPSISLVEEKLEDEGFGQNALAPQFFASFDEFIETNRSTKALGTVKKYNTVRGFLLQFQNYTSYKIHFDNINTDFYEKFREYCFTERDTLNNYFGKLIAIVKTFMNWSFERGYHNNLEFKKFKRTEDNIEVIYLTMDELMTLYNYNFTSPRLSQVRDVYCFGCFTGLRFSDIKQLSISNVFPDYLKLNIVKTKTIDQKIPLNKYSKHILEKYSDTIYAPLPIISSQKFNDYIKVCCAKAGINTPVTTTRYIGRRRIDKTVAKHDLITSHTARKTFVTNSLVLGMKEMVVRNITGHKDEASFKRYVDIAEDFKQKEMDNTWNNI